MLTILGQSGGPTELAANDTLGVMTQVPEKGIRHSPNGLKGATGNRNYGTPFDLNCYVAHATSTETAVDFCSSDAPYNFLIMGGEVTCLDDGKGASEGGQNGCSVGVNKGGASSIGSVDCGGMKVGEVRKIDMGMSGNDVVSTDDSLRVQANSRLGLHDKAFTYKLLITLRCVRVI
jgi:hypothetical protein